MGDNFDCRSPHFLFNQLKAVTTYQDDPHPDELFHAPQSLFLDNYHGISGAGDCDDFTIASLAGLMAGGHDCRIILAGNKWGKWTHIAAGVVEDEGVTPFDLVAPDLGVMKEYNHHKVLLP